MRLVFAISVPALMCAIVACSDSEPTTSSVPPTPSATPATTSQTSSAPVTVAEAPKDEKPEAVADSKDAAADDEPAEPDWMKDCLPFIPCFPPDPPPAEACPPFDPICQTNAASGAVLDR